MLNITTKNENGTVTCSLEVRLDTTTAPDLDDKLKALPEETKELILDFKDLEYISSAGLRVLLATQKAMIAKEGTMKVCNVNEMINEIFEVTGFSEILTVE